MARIKPTEVWQDAFQNAMTHILSATDGKINAKLLAEMCITIANAATDAFVKRFGKQK
jgi:hypothetical protein